MARPITVPNRRYIGAVILSLFPLLSPTLLAATPTNLVLQDALDLETASQDIRDRVDSLSIEKPGDLHVVERDLKIVMRAVSVYYHGNNLRSPKARPIVLRMRKVIHALRAQPAPLLVLVNDVFEFSPHVHDALVRAYTGAGRSSDASRHRALAVHVRLGLTTPPAVPAPQIRQ